jgi:hypothetical protein
LCIRYIEDENDNDEKAKTIRQPVIHKKDKSNKSKSVSNINSIEIVNGTAQIMKEKMSENDDVDNGNGCVSVTLTLDSGKLSKIGYDLTYNRDLLIAFRFI